MSTSENSTGQNPPDWYPKLGQTFVKEFYIIAVVPKIEAKGFFVCGTGGIPTSTSEVDGVRPTITPDREQALQWYEEAKRTYAKMREHGVLVLIKFAGGIIDKMQEYEGAEIPLEELNERAGVKEKIRRE